MADYRVLVGINYGASNKRAEIGDVVSDLPPQSIKWLREYGAIEAVDATEKPAKSAKAAKPAPTPEPAPEPAPAPETTPEGEDA